MRPGHPVDLGPAIGIPTGCATTLNPDAPPCTSRSDASAAMYVLMATGLVDNPRRASRRDLPAQAAQTRKGSGSGALDVGDAAANLPAPPAGLGATGAASVALRAVIAQSLQARYTGDALAAGHRGPALDLDPLGCVRQSVPHPEGSVPIDVTPAGRTCAKPCPGLAWGRSGPGPTGLAQPWALPPRPWSAQPSTSGGHRQVPRRAAGADRVPGRERQAAGSGAPSTGRPGAYRNDRSRASPLSPADATGAKS